MKSVTGYLLTFLLLSITPASAHEFYFGADLSFANEMDDCGVIYRDGGKSQDLFGFV